MKTVFFLLFSTMLFSHVARADSDNMLNFPNQKFEKLKYDMEFCSHEDSSNMKLSCYEKAGRNAGANIQFNNTDDISKWNMDSSPSSNIWMAYTKSTYEHNSHHAVLTISCNAGRTVLYISYGSPVGHYPLTVDIGADAGSLTHYEFQSSQSNDALGLWDSSSVISLVKYFLSIKNSLFIKTNFKDGSQEDIFNLNGMDQAIIPLRRSCGW